MRFTTFTNSFIKLSSSTVALVTVLSLIPAANAKGPVYLEVLLPESGETFVGGYIGEVRWYVPKSGKLGGKP
jgi:hypothetical protein